MKKHFIILNLLLPCAFAQISYFNNMPMYGYCPCYNSHYNNIYRPVRNPYSNFYNPYYRYNSVRVNYPSNIPRRLRRMQRFEKKKLNTLSFLNNKGSMTGYSVPINHDDIYKQMGISPYDPNKKEKYNSINCSEELFSAPQGNETYYNNGEYIRDLKGNSGKTGVTIIYD